MRVILFAIAALGAFILFPASGAMAHGRYDYRMSWGDTAQQKAHIGVRKPSRTARRAARGAASKRHAARSAVLRAKSKSSARTAREAARNKGRHAAQTSVVKRRAAARARAHARRLAASTLHRRHAAVHRDSHRAHASAKHGRRAANLGGIVHPLAAKATEIVNACGAQVISGMRHTRVAGSGRMSLHASGRAVDIAGNPGCIYAHLRSWPGGYSTDYGAVRHVHVSYDPQGRREWGIRFAHYGGHSRYRRYARNHAHPAWFWPI